ncbi:MAG: hypothetical protein MUC65_09780 [Pontiellaceae bacterium]|jgi:hypothetical protein|nr:hypothetical protein [Pontiellaceae bacterium]
MSESKKDRLKRLARNDQFISGIYNYCDRWCERCTLRNKCFSFAMDSDLRTENSPHNDPNNEEFWDGIHESFALAFELLQESAEKWGVDLNSDPDPKREKRERRRDRQTERDPLLKNSMAYAKAVDAWMDERKTLFGEKARQTEREIEMELPGHDPLPEVIALHEAVEVIRWYQYFLYPKISRAMSGLLDDERDMMDDVFGSAKIALIALERSIGAWQTLGRLLQQSDDVLELQIQLTKIKTELERRIPAARDFKRPGFDD